MLNSATVHHAAITKANYALAEYSTRQTQALQQFLDLDHAQTAPGTLKIFRMKKKRAEALRLAKMLAAQGLVFETLDKTALLKREPSLDAAEDIIGALYFPNDGIGDARLFCEQLAQAAIKRSGEMRLNAKVQSLLVEGGRVVGVKLAEQEIRGVVRRCGRRCADPPAPHQPVNTPRQGLFSDT